MVCKGLISDQPLTDKELITNFLDGSRMSRVSCVLCRYHRKKCSRSFPECATCVKRGVTCEYRKRRARNSKVNNENIYAPLLYRQIPNTEMDYINNNCIKQVYKYNVRSNSSDDILNLKSIQNEPKSLNLLALNSESSISTFSTQLPSLVSTKKRSVSLFDLSKISGTEKKKNTEFNLTYSKQPFEVINMLLQNSYIDNTCKSIYKNKDGSLEYYGSSPVGALIMMHLDLNKMSMFKSSLCNTGGSHKTPHILNKGSLLGIGLASKWFIEESTAAYFSNYSCFFPILDEQYMVEHPSPLISKLVVAIGSKYISEKSLSPKLTSILDQEAINQFKNDFPRPTSDIIFGLMLIGQYQVGSSEFGSAWLYQSFNGIYSIMFGLDKPLPKSYNLTPRQVRLRCHQWWACCIQDKLNTNLLNRPMLVQAFDWTLHYPKFDPLPILPNSPSSNQFILIRDILSGIYFKYCTQIHELIGHSNACLKHRFTTVNTIEAHRMCQKLFKMFNECYASFILTMTRVVYNQPDWVKKFAEPLIFTNLNYCNTTLIRLCSYFTREKDSALVYVYNCYAAHYSTSILRYAEYLGYRFFRYGVVYKLFAVSSATLVHTKLSTRSQTPPHIINNSISDGCNIPPLPSISESIALRQLGLKLLEGVHPYYAVADEFFNLTVNIVGLDS